MSYIESNDKVKIGEHKVRPDYSRLKTVADLDRHIRFHQRIDVVVGSIAVFIAIIGVVTLAIRSTIAHLIAWL